MIPTLTIMADFMGVAGGHFYSDVVLGIDMHHYWYNSARLSTGSTCSRVCSRVFSLGRRLRMVSCYQGFNCDPGAEGVGRASTASFVYSFVLILILDLFLGIFLDKFYFVLFPQRTPQLF